MVTVEWLAAELAARAVADRRRSLDERVDDRDACLLLRAARELDHAAAVLREHEEVCECPALP